MGTDTGGARASHSSARAPSAARGGHWARGTGLYAVSVTIFWHERGALCEVVILAMGVGLFVPPFGLGYYAACTIGRVNPDTALLRIWPYLGMLVLGLVLIAAVPWISTGFLPR